MGKDISIYIIIKDTYYINKCTNVYPSNNFIIILKTTCCAPAVWNINNLISIIISNRNHLVCPC